MNPVLHRRIRWCFFSFLLLSSILTVSLVYSQAVVASQPSENPREGWAVLMEMNEYPNTDSDLPTNFTDTIKWNATLHTLGWQSNHIYIHQGYLDQATGQTALQFLSLNADENDVVLFFIFAHGNWILNDMNWNSWFPTHWQGLISQEKFLVVSACGSESMIIPLLSDEAPHIHLASAQLDEYSWAGLPDEGLPIIGEVFSHYLTNALVNVSADQNGDGDVSVEEAFSYAAPLTRSYLLSVVFPAFPDFADMCNNNAPYPVIDDSYPENFSLQVALGDPPINPSTLPFFEFAIILLTVLICGAILVLGLFLMRKRRVPS